MQNILRFNPLHHYVLMFRSVMMDGAWPNLRSHVVCGTISLTFLLVGLLVFKWKQGRFILYM